MPSRVLSDESMMSADVDAMKLRQYFQEAADLRLCLQLNYEDYEFARTGGRIFYIMDANIVVFFLNPVREARHVRAFDSSGIAKHTAATALITAEFLFSRSLAGQNGYPALIAPSHAEELGDVLDEIRKSIAPEGDASSTLAKSTRRGLKELIDGVRSGRIPRDAAVKELRRLVPEFAIDQLEGGFQEANQFLRLYRDDLVRPLAVHSEATGDVLDVELYHKQWVEQWTDRILPERMRVIKERIGSHSFEHGRHPPGYSPESERKRARRDAKALVQTLLLDKVGCQASQPTRYVLVSADRALVDAYAKWFWRDGRSDNVNSRFILRHPLQYVPILNIKDMPNGIDRADIFDRTRDALDSLLAPLRSVDPHGYPQSLSIHRVLARVSADNSELQAILKRLYGENPFAFKAGSAPLFERVKSDWQDGFRDGVVLNAELMRRRARSEFEPLVCLLREDVDLRTAIIEDQRSILTQLEAAHLTVNTGVSIERLLINADQINADQTNCDVPPRGALAIRAKFPRIVGQSSLQEVLDNVATGIDRDLIRHITKALEKAFDHEALFFSACLAHRCSRWHTALQYSNRALDFLESECAKEGRTYADAELHEIRYLAASATRYALPSIEAIRRAVTLLEQGESYARLHNDRFGLVRALCEHSALLLVVIYRDHFLAPGNAVPDVVHVQEVERLPNQMEEARIALTALREGVQDDELCRPIDVLATQVWANVISAEVISHLLPVSNSRKELVRPGPALLKLALVAMEAKLALGQYPPVLEAEYVMVQYFQRLVTPANAARALRAAKERGLAGGHRLTEVDSAEFDQFLGILVK